ncbi:hypothetical protein SAMN05443244_3915 [Terriglobus roseus]|uniref:Uncharacterized protein n=1 Tax=Terriglobus roseus TaxID=392734 RepID=A0A1H4U016_9BACT|nr:hypothetical protein SAMN05443244_3915 [Terriglobus roseus]
MKQGSNCLQSDEPDAAVIPAAAFCFLLLEWQLAECIGNPHSKEKETKTSRHIPLGMAKLFAHQAAATTGRSKCSDGIL